MTAAREIIAALVAAGMDAVEAAALMARAAVEMAPSAPQKSAGALRQQRYRERNKASQTVTTLRSGEASQTVTNRNESVTRDAASLSIESNSDSETKKKKRESRASQLPDGWRPDADAWQASVERLGSAQRAEQELNKFRNHALDKGRTSKRWGAAWANWVDRAIVYAGGNVGNGTSSNRTAAPAGHSQTGADSILAGMGRLAARVHERQLAEQSGDRSWQDGFDFAGGDDAKRH